MGKGQHVQLITRPISFDEHLQEIVIGLVIGDQRIELPMDTRVEVGYDAGASIGTVTATLFADTVRYRPEEALPKLSDKPPLWDELLDVLRDMVDGSPCVVHPEGMPDFCEAHAEDEPCPHRRAKALLGVLRPQEE
jgi:hypothetical protein